PRLTLNYGLRYEIGTPPRERDKQWANFDFATQKFISSKDGSLFDQALIHPDYNDFAPRFGFSFAATPRTVIRGSYGVFYNHMNRLGREGLLGFNFPFIITRSDTVAGSNTAKIENALIKLSDGVPAGWIDASKVNPANVGRKAQDSNQRSPYTQQWN